MAPRAAAPARRNASVSPCGRPPGWVQPRPTTRSLLTMTQPTAGFGQTVPSPRRASDSAACIVPRPRPRSAPSIAIRGDPSDKIPEILGFAKIPVDRGEADIGHLIEACQRLHDQPANRFARDVGLARTLQLAHQRVDDALDAFGLDRTLAQSDVDRAGELVAVERLALPMFLDDRQFAQLHPFEGGKAGRA